MTEPLTPQTLETLAADYVLGNLDHNEVIAFEKLMAENSALAAEVNQLQVTLDRVAYDLNSVEPPPHLRSTILAAATNTQLISRPKRSQFP